MAFSPELLITLDSGLAPPDTHINTTPGHYYLWNSPSNKPSTIDAVRTLLGSRKIDFLFIDGGHTQDVVEADVTNYVPCVRPGGIVAFHDILPFNDMCQVRPVWERLKTEHHYAEFKLGPASTGLGVLFL
jgi:hypothetical protein